MFDKKSFREQMEQRILDEQNKKTNTIFKTVFKSDVPTWREKEGDNILDVIPFHAGKNAELYNDPKIVTGKWVYRLPILLHKGVGVNEDNYICLNSMLRQPCPICEYRKKLKDKGVSWEVYQKYFPKKRSLFNVWVQNNDKEYKKGVLVWDISDFLGWDKIYPITENIRGGGRIYFMEYEKEEGRSVAFRRKEISRGKVEYSGYQLLARDYDIPNDIKEGVHILDELIYIPTYDEVSETFYSTVNEEEHENNSENSNNDEEFDMDQKFERNSRVRQMAETHEPVTVAEEGIPRESERAPTRSTRIETQQTSIKEEIKSEEGCPAGFIYGSDFDLMDECRNCNAYRGCQDTYNKRMEERAARQGNTRSRR